jgi:tetratricopeptide (TPR) repeat protein
VTADSDLVGEALEAHRRGEPAAAGLLERALQSNPRDGRLLIAHAEAAAMAGEPDPLSRLQRMVDLSPDWVDGQLALAGLVFELGDESRFASRLVEALRRNPANAGLWNAYIQALVGAGQPRQAADAARDARAYFDLPVLKLIEANHASAAGQLDRAGKLLANVPEEIPEYPEVGARHFARTGDYARSLRLLDILRARNPTDISSWALTELLWRKTADPRAEWLSLDPAFVSTADLGMTAEEVAELAGLLRSLHTSHSRPLGQSARGGTQTRGELFRRREPQIQQLRARIQEALDSYRQALPPADPAHPLLCCRGEAWIADGGWSIRLQSSGYHVAHIHPSGLVSSACYIVVPPTGSNAREGQLEIGRAPDDLAIDLEPITSIAPRPGMLALFPSFLYHGTRPFGSGERLSVAFDAHCAARSA